MRKINIPKVNDIIFVKWYDICSVVNEEKMWTDRLPMYTVGILVRKENVSKKIKYFYLVTTINPIDDYPTNDLIAIPTGTIDYIKFLGKYKPDEKGCKRRKGD